MNRHEQRAYDEQTSTFQWAQALNPLLAVLFVVALIVLAAVNR